MLKKKDRIITSVRKQETIYLKKNDEFCIELPKTVEQALALDAKNNSTLWVDAISKEKDNVRVSFEFLPDGKSVPIGHQFVQCHMVFKIKIEDFKCKARFVAGAHMAKGQPFLCMPAKCPKRQLE